MNINRIIREALPDLPANIKRVIVYYIDITDRDDIEQFIKEQNNQTTIEIELRDLKQFLDDIVVVWTPLALRPRHRPTT